MFANPDAPPSLAKLSGELSMVLSLVQDADTTPTPQAATASDRCTQALAEILKRWNDLKAKELKSVNEQLRQASLPPIGLEKEQAIAP
jgi:hypothetical protein